MTRCLVHWKTNLADIFVIFVNIIIHIGAFNQF